MLESIAIYFITVDPTGMFSSNELEETSTFIMFQLSEFIISYCLIRICFAFDLNIDLYQNRISFRDFIFST